jgi:hypothetical protein
MGFGDLSSIGNILGGSGGDPIASIIDEVGNALGLSPELTGAAKIGAACFTGDVMCGVSGGAELVQGLDQNSQQAQPQPATTECPDQGAACGGYAGSAPATQAPVQDPSQNSGGLLGGLLGGGGGSGGGIGGLLGGLLGGGGSGGGLEGLLGGLLGGGGSNPIEMLLGPITNLLGLGSASGQGSATTSTPTQMPPPDNSNSTPTQIPPPDNSTQGALQLPPHQCTLPEWKGFCHDVNQSRGSDSRWDSQFNNALHVLNDHYDLLEHAAGHGGHGITRDDLRAAAGNPEMPDNVKDACKFLLRNPAAYNMIDAASGHGRLDGRITRGDVHEAEHEVGHPHGDMPDHHRKIGHDDHQDFAHFYESRDSQGVRGHHEHHQMHSVDGGGAPISDPAGASGSSGGPSSSGGSASNGSSMGDGSMDINQMFSSGMDIQSIVNTVLSQCLQNMDNQIENQSNAVAQASNSQSANGQGGSTGSSQGTQGSSSSNDLQQMQQQLQDLVQQRQQLYTLMTNMSSSFSQTSQQILSNLGKA